MIIRKIASASFLTVLMTSTAHAGFYVGGNIGNASPGLDEVEDTVAFSAMAGFQIPDSAIFFEGTAHLFNDANVENEDATNNDVTISVEGVTAGVGLRAPRESKNQLGAHIKVGIYLLDVSASGSFITNGVGYRVSEGEKSEGVMVAAGFDYPLARNLYLTADLTGFLGVDYLTSDEGVGIYSLGAKYEF